MGPVRRRRSAAHVLTGVSAGLLVVAVVSWNRLATRIPVIPLVLVIAAVACAATAGELYRRSRPQRHRPSAPPIRWWWVVMAFAAVATAVWITTALLMPQTDGIQPDHQRTRQRIDVVRTALAAGAGVGAAVTVLLAFRRQHHHETATVPNRTRRHRTAHHRARAEPLWDQRPAGHTIADCDATNSPATMHRSALTRAEAGPARQLPCKVTNRAARSKPGLLVQHGRPDHLGSNACRNSLIIVEC